MEQSINGAKPTLKLNFKRTFLIGFAFFGILLLWQVYDSWCPTLLTDILKNKMNMSDETQVQWLVGIIMACDNLAALILLPIFGNLSDKTKSPIGKRMPYILIGTFVSAVAFPFIPFFFHYNNVAGMIACMAIVLIFMMMYRNPAVALMPDITPKPLRAKANGIINVMGYLGGACATVLGIFLSLSKKYLAFDQASRNIWIVEIPFLVASLLMVISALVLFFTIKENKLEAEMKEELELGEKLAAIETPIDDDKPMCKANKIMLFGILAAEFLWFMCDNAIGTYANNFVIYALRADSSGTSTLIIIGGVASVIGFITAGMIADKIGRKWCVSIGLALYIIGAVLLCTIPTYGNDVALNSNKLPMILYAVYIIKGYGIALVNTCSFPMVVELCSSKKIGKFTGYYYAASMSAQTITPVLLGLLLTTTGAWKVLPWYCLIFITLSFIVFTLIVKNIKAVKVENVKGLEALAADD